MHLYIVPCIGNIYTELIAQSETEAEALWMPPLVELVVTLAVVVDALMPALPETDVDSLDR